MKSYSLARPGDGTVRALLRLAGLAVALVGGAAEAQTFRYVQVDVGQGDAAIVVSPGGCAALFDGGPTGSGARIKASARALGITQFQLAVISHMHADHMGGMDEVEQGADGIPIVAVYDHGGSYRSTAFDQYATAFAGRRHTAVAGSTLSLCGEVALEVLASNANGAPVRDENARSVVVRVDYRGLSAMVGGDLSGGSPDQESALATQVGEVDLYKVHHHGSRTSSNEVLLDALQPTIAVISVAAHNSYGHPHAETLARLDATGSEVWRTEDDTGRLGDVQLESLDGRAYTVTQGARSSSYGTKHSTAAAPTMLPVTRGDGLTVVKLPWSATERAPKPRAPVPHRFAYARPVDGFGGSGE